MPVRLARKAHLNTSKAAAKPPLHCLAGPGPRDPADQ